MSFLASQSSAIYQQFGILKVFQSNFFDIFGIGIISLTDGVQLSIAQTEFKYILIGLRPLIYFSLYKGIRILLFLVGKGDSIISASSFIQITEVMLGEGKFYPNQKDIELIPRMGLCDFKKDAEILSEEATSEMLDFNIIPNNTLFSEEDYEAHVWIAYNDVSPEEF
jgi:hypothetical protein